MGITFQTDNSVLQATFHAALQGLQDNIVQLHDYKYPVLREGSDYDGIWLECGPHEGAVYAAINPDIALHNHRIFFHYQREDGYFPCWVRSDRIGAAQIQMVVPIAATAYEVYELIRDDQFLENAYNACTRWDDWLMRYRNTRGTGLCEAFCEFDTGHDNSPRWHNLPRQSRDLDARLCPEVDILPYLAPDLSATVYGGRLALAKMARTLGHDNEAAQWEERAEQIRRAILAYCFDPEDLSFYDLDNTNHFIRIRGDAMVRVLSEHVVDQALFDAIYERHIRNPNAFWTPYPLPSIAADDPAFVPALPRNSWGGASQALTALRAPRWFNYYGKHADLTIMMQQWVKALSNAPGFLQQLNPWTGEFTPAESHYSPAMLVLIEYITRLHGVRRAADLLEWTCILPFDSSASTFILDTPQGQAKLQQDRDKATLTLNDTLLAQVQGSCRIITDLNGNLKELIGVNSSSVQVTITLPAAEARQLQVQADQSYVVA